MKHLLSIVFVFFFTSIQELSSVRELYIIAPNSKENTEKLYVMFQEYQGNNKILRAYKGASVILKARFSTQLKEKKEYFSKGKEILESAVKSDPTALEIRIIRLGIQENTPKILNYKANIQEDKQLVLTTFDKQNNELKKYIRGFVNQSKLFTATEKALIAK